MSISCKFTLQNFHTILLVPRLILFLMVLVKSFPPISLISPHLCSALLCSALLSPSLFCFSSFLLPWPYQLSPVHSEVEKGSILLRQLLLPPFYCISRASKEEVKVEIEEEVKVEVEEVVARRVVEQQDKVIYLMKFSRREIEQSSPPSSAVSSFSPSALSMPARARRSSSSPGSSGASRSVS